MAGTTRQLSVMVSSTAYDLKHELRQIEGVLLGYGYRPIISDRNRMGVNPKSHNFDSCIRAVENCDLFIGIITPTYGTGVKEKGDKSITHLELLKAIDTISQGGCFAMKL